MSCSILPSFLQLWYDYKQIWIYVIIFACGWFLWFFFSLICEDKQLWSWDGAEALYGIVIFMTLSGWVYGIGHTTAVREKSSLGVGSSLPHCFAFILSFFFPEVKTRLLLVLLQYTGSSYSPPAVIQQYRIEYQLKFQCIWHKLIINKTIPFKDITSCSGEPICELNSNNSVDRSNSKKVNMTERGNKEKEIRKHTHTEKFQKQWKLWVLFELLLLQALRSMTVPTV